jgi:hypothetical protein
VRDEVPERFARAADSRPSLLKTFGKARQRARGDLTSQGAAVSSGAVALAKAASPPWRDAGNRVSDAFVYFMTVVA